MSKREFKDVQSAREYLNKLNSKIAEYNDLEFNLNEQLTKQNNSIKSLKNMQQSLKRENFSLWENQSRIDQQVQDLEDTETTIDDIIGGIDL